MPEPEVTATGGTMEPAPGTPAPAAAPVTPATPPAGTPAETPEPSPWDDPVAAKAEIEKLRRENGAARTTAKQQAADEARQALAQQIGKTLGLVKDDTKVDPAELTSQLTQTQAEAKAARLELAVYKAANTAKADPAALLDSRAFLAQVASIDPTDTAALAAAISGAITANPRLRVTQAATVGGADIAGGSGITRTYSRAQLANPAFFQANKSDILAALSEGRITS